jgi:Protein of unknown function (DUF6044)
VKNRAIWIGLGIVFLYLIPYILLGSNSHVRVHDSLDSDVAKFKTLAESGKMFAPLDATVPEMMNALPRVSLPSEFNGSVWLYYFFQPYAAYVINQFVMHFVAFFGMFLLVRKYLITDTEHRFLVVCVAAAFAILPFHPSAGLCVAGMPLVVYAFMNIRSEIDNARDWLILLAVPFYAYFEYSYFFLVVLLGLVCVADIAKYKKLNTRFFLSLCFFTAVSLLVEFRLVIGMFLDSSFVSHRVEFHAHPIFLMQAIESSVSDFIFGQKFENLALQQYFIAISIIAASFLILKKKLREDTFIAAIIVTALISIWFGFWNWRGWTPLKQHITLLNSFDLSRFQWLHPLLWYVVFALALKIIIEHLKFGKTVAYVLVSLQFAFLFYNHEEITTRQQGEPTYRQFYSEALFKEVKDYIGKDQKDYRIVSIGLYPSIARFNGFYTLDAYLVNYPLAYKHKFRAIIENELNKNATLKTYFDDWGSRCYIFVDELGMRFSYTKFSNKSIRHLQLNTKALKDLGGGYIFSAVEIQNANENSLQMERSFESPESPWKIYLYKVL